MTANEMHVHSDVCKAGLQKLLDSAINWGATLGNMQIYNPSNKCLEIVVQHGFNDFFLDNFSSVETTGSTICAMAFRLGSRVCFSDLNQNPKFALMLSRIGTNYFNAVQSTPILSKDGLVIGVFSTHFPQPINMTSEMEEAWDAIAEDMATQIENHVPEVIPSF
ncbi:uncharacterized protein NMK_2632 [Novimethylophilus kurashikiensis]|uniref:GAF domain-containing protein n=1 Tax=Novimethylophilus kurashikiensis TaxID=1825523 RepID=A0A2R5FF12_9PROT|nr:GAF domain-containing protein [Novimethylophilus kurashikiensis]GBG15031.1 uncharacterized protein NMK_2632 [Novimethylophilus kurashikiensis]